MSSSNGTSHNRKLNEAAVLLGRMGGARNTPKQQAARLRNSKLGGRPKMWRVVRGVLERRVKEGVWQEVEKPYSNAAKAFLKRQRQLS